MSEQLMPAEKGWRHMSEIVEAIVEQVSSKFAAHPATAPERPVVSQATLPDPERKLSGTNDQISA